MTYFDRQGASVCLDRKLANGGEGEIFEMAAKPHELAKIYRHASASMPHLQPEKLGRMSACAELGEHPRFAWPRRLLFTSNGTLGGFVMRRAPGNSLVPLSAQGMRERSFPGWTKIHLCRVVHDIAAGCEFLSQRGVLLGDVSLTNFLVDPVEAAVTFIDCDSYQVTAGDRCFPCSVYTPDFLPPELLLMTGAKPVLAAEQVHFSVAVLFFMIFTAGGHPYSIVNGSSPVENILAGRHFMGGKGVATGCTTEAIWNRYRNLSRWIMKLFKRAFIDGHSNPAQRPTFREWADAALDYAEKLRAARFATIC